MSESPPSSQFIPPSPEARVLPTLNSDGTRRWLDPKLSHGRFLTARRWVAWALIAVFGVLPWVRMGGEPAVLLDLAHRRFVLFGSVFFATDTIFLMLLGLSIGLAVFLATALFGRVWCGWACPQTVYMEFLYRPIDRFFARQRGLVGKLPPPARTALRAAAYLAASVYLAHTFLAYFVGTDALRHWVRSSPSEHPVAFVIMAGTTLMMLVDFGFFREQMCTVACPYARLQSVLFDKDSLVVGYDRARGEARGKMSLRKGPEAATFGDCIDCKACVVTCPTGIDIRDGLQLECIACTQCVDACDSIMDRIGKPRGLVRYASQRSLESGAARRLVRPRTIIYPTLLTLVAGALAFMTLTRAPAELTLLHVGGPPFVELERGRIANVLRLRIESRTQRPLRLDAAPVGATDVEVVGPQLPVTVAPEARLDTVLQVIAPRSTFVRGSRSVVVRVSDGAGFTQDLRYRLMGPEGVTP